MLTSALGASSAGL